MAIGIVRVFDANKLYAEISPERGGATVTAFMQELQAAGLTDLKVGDMVNYEVGSDGHVSQISRA